jgi:hypothetical protein
MYEGTRFLQWRKLHELVASIHLLVMSESGNSDFLIFVHLGNVAHAILLS